MDTKKDSSSWSRQPARRRSISASSDADRSLLPSGKQLALAILLVDGRYLLQLRDDRPDIEAPGQWALFGGRIEPQENPQNAVTREVEEELCARVEPLRFLWRTEVADGGLSTTYWFYEGDFTRHWGRHDVREGQSAQCYAYPDVAPLRMPDLIRETLRRHHAATHGHDD